MNKVKLSVVALLLSSTYVFGGGDIEPIMEPEVVMPDIIESQLTGFYAGLGYSCLQMGLDHPYLDIQAMTALSVEAGYNFNEYIGVEGRYTTSIGDITVKNVQGVEHDTDTIEMQNIALYVKPQYTMDLFSVYGLLGYGQFSIDDGSSSSEAGIQFGAGANVMVGENIGLFADFRRLYDDETGFGTLSEEIMANSYTLGVNYHF